MNSKIKWHTTDPHHRQREGLLLQILSSMEQDERQNLHSFSEPHLVGQDSTGPLNAGQREFSNYAKIMGYEKVFYHYKCLRAEREKIRLEETKLQAGSRSSYVAFPSRSSL